jgi:hypothetical protein
MWTAAKRKCILLEFRPVGLLHKRRNELAQTVTKEIGPTVLGTMYFQFWLFF